MNHPLMVVRHGARRAPVIRNCLREERAGFGGARCPRLGAIIRGRRRRRRRARAWVWGVASRMSAWWHPGR